MDDYSDAFAALAHVYLEDSYVLAVLPADDSVTFDLEAVLTEGHPDYRGPSRGEQYDYRRAELVISGDHLEFRPSAQPPSVDASGSTDLGNIDSWLRDEDKWSYLEGEW